jgi:hypothetical protein
MLINDVVIPADTSDLVIATSNDGGVLTEFENRVTPALQFPANLNPVYIGDIEGTLAKKEDKWVFNRASAGESVTINRPTAIRTYHDINHNSPYLMTIFMGQNDGTKYNSDNTNINDNLVELIRKHRLMIEHSHAENVIVLGLSSGTAESRSAYESAMRKEFGRYFISLREYLTAYGLEDRGLTATEEDITAIENGQVPPQLLSDSVHYAVDTRTIIGDMVYKKCKELGIF